MTIRVLLVDDQALVRAGFAMVLGSQPDIDVVGEAADGRAAVRLARERPADVMVMDVRMPEQDGVAATREICRAGERPRVLILTTFDLDEYAYAALRAGASGFLLKSAPPEELLYAIRCACMSSCSVWEIDCSSCASAEYGWFAKFLAWLINIVAWFSRLWISLLTCCSSRAAVRTFCEKLVGSYTIHCA